MPDSQVGSASHPINHTLSESELRKLSTLAIAAKRQAYCPYSNFRVGCAILIETPSHGGNGSDFYQGANCEVASTPVGSCAEVTAMTHLVTSFERPSMPRVRALAVSSDIYPGASPCGKCRQMIREFSDAKVPVYMYGRAKDQGQVYTSDITAEEEYEICGKPVVMTIGDLLPLSFGSDGMTIPPT